MRRALKVVSSLGSAALILSGAAMAAGPVGYDGWSVTGGVMKNAAGTSNLEGSCPAGFVCGAAVTGNGFFQRQITNAAGDRFFQTMISNEGATGNPSATSGSLMLDFADESYVKIGSSGLADKQQVNDAVNEFKTNSQINTGWADTGTNSLSISQVLTETATNFATSFAFTNSSSGGLSIDMDQRVVLQNNGPTGLGSEDDVQRFVLRERAGTVLTAPGTFTLPGSPAKSQAFAAGEDVKVIWVGQDMPSMGQKFGFQSYTNLSRDTAPADGNPDSISYFDNASTGPWNWATTVFGTAPTFP